MKITKTRLKEIVKSAVISESEYKDFFQKALDKAGKSIPAMSDEEKKAFFNKIDAAWDAKGEKNEALVGGQKELDVDGDGDIGGDDLADLRAGKKADESINEEEIKWNAVENAIINFLKANTKILDKRVKDRDTDGVKGGLKSIISGLTNAQRSLKLESVNEATLKPGTKLRYEKNNYVIDYVVDKEYKGNDGFTRYILKVVKSNYPNKIKVGSTEEYENSRLSGLIRNGVIKFVKNESVNEAKYPTDLKIGSVILGQGFTRLKGIEGGRYYKIVDMDDTTATLVPSDKNGNTKGSTKVRHKLDSIEGGIKTAKRGDENGIVVIKESVNEAKFKSPDYIISTTPASKLPPTRLAHADVSLGLKMAEKLKNYTLDVRHYNLIHANGKVALKLTQQGKTAVRVRTEDDPKYLQLIQKTVNDVVADYVSKLKESVNEDAPIYKDWDEFVNPHYILVTLKNGKKLKIEKKNVKGGTNVYHAILKAFNDNNHKITNKVVSGMLDRLGESVNEDKLNEEAKPILKPGTKVKLRGGKSGKIVRFDGKTPGSPFYIVDIGQYYSIEVPAYELETESVNEIASRTAMEIGALTGTNKDFIQNFVDKNELDIEKVFQYVKKGKLKDRMDFVTAVVGKPNNPFQVKLIKQFKK
jgi:hypothetical protein